MRVSLVLAAVVLAGCAGTRVPPPVVDGTQAAGPQDRVRTTSQPAPKKPVQPVIAETQVQTVQVAKI